MEKGETTQKNFSKLDYLIAQNGFAILDGSSGTCLESRGLKLDSDLWTTKLLISDIKSIESLHKDYLLNGADIITTVSYQISLYKLPKHHFPLSVVDSEKYFRKSIQVAKRIRDKYGKNKFVACSLSPIGANMKIGGIPGEYVGTYVDFLKENEIISFHKKRIFTAIEEKPNILLFETYPALEEVKIICNKILSTIFSKKINSLPLVIFSFSCKDGQRTFKGDLISDCAKFLNKFDFVYAIGINCTKPIFMNNLVKILKRNTKKRIIAYPNSGEEYVRDKKSNKFMWKNVGEKIDWENFGQSLHECGSDIVGGCCRTNPKIISLIKRGISKRTKNQKKKVNSLNFIQD